MAKDHVVARISADIEELKADLQAATKEFKKFGKKLEKAIPEDPFKSVERAAEGIDLSNALDSAQDLRNQFRAAGDAIDEAAEKSRRLKTAIKVAFEDPKVADEFIAEAAKIKDAYGDLIDEDDIAQSIKRLDTLQAATTSNLQRIAKLAVDAGKDMEDAADDFGEFAANFESGNFDPGVLETLRANYGVSAKALEEFGAKLDTNRKLLVDTKEQQLAAQEALKRYIDESSRFNNIAKRSKDDLAKLRDETDKFKRSVGENVDALKNLAAGALLPVLEQINKLPDGLKTAGAALIVGGSAAVNFGTNIAQSALIFKALGGKFPAVGAKVLSFAGKVRGLGNALTGLRAAQLTATAGASAMAGGLAIAAAGLVVIAKTAYDYSKAIDQAEQAEGRLIKTLSQAILANKEAIKIRKLSVTQVREEAKAIDELAKRRIYLTKAIIEAEDALETARQSGDRDDIVAAQGRLDEFLMYRAEVDRSIAEDVRAEKAVEKATKERFERSLEAYKVYKKEFDRGQFDSQKKALAALESIASGLSGDSLKEAQSDIRKLQKEILNEEVDGLKKRIAAEEVSAKESKVILSGLLAKYEANSDQKKKVEEDVSDALKSQLEKRAARTREYLQRELDLEKSALEQKRSLAEDSDQVHALEARLAKGEDVFTQLKSELSKRNEILKTYIDEEAALERIAIKRQAAADVEADPKGAESIKRQAAERERQLNDETAARKSALDRELADRTTKLDQDRAKRNADLAQKRGEIERAQHEEELARVEESFQRRREKLELEASLGKNVAFEKKRLSEEELAAQEALIKRKLELAEQEIKARQAAADVGATTEEKELNAQNAALEMSRAKREAERERQGVVDKSNESLIKQTQELQKQLELLRQQNEEKKRGEATLGGISGIDQVNENTGGFGVSRQEREASERELEEKIARNQGILNSRENRRKKTGESYEKPGSKADSGATEGVDGSGDDSGASPSPGAAAQETLESGAITPNLLIELTTQIASVLKSILQALQTGGKSSGNSAGGNQTTQPANSDPLPTKLTPYQYQTNRS